MPYPKSVLVECDNEECRHHDGFHNCKKETININFSVIYEGDEEIRIPICKSIE
jgi:hypothetical protein